jgi:hypothetical protein
MNPYGDLIERAESVAALLSGEAREQAEGVIALCRSLEVRPREQERLVQDPGDLDAKRALGRWVELLARRSSTAIGMASLGRAALADLAGDSAGFRDARRDCDVRFSLLGL